MKKKPTKKPDPKMLGTGGASKTGSTIAERQAKQKCIIEGGTWKPGIGCIQ